MSQGLINRKGFPRWVLLVSSSFVPSPLLLRWPKMPNRVEKQKRSSTLQRHNLLALFEECCFDAMPCSRCTEKGLRCRWVDEKKQTKQQKKNETNTRLVRLRRHREAVVAKGVKMVQEGLRDMEELEEFESRETAAVVDSRAQGAVGVIDWSSVGLEWPEGLTLGPSSASLGIAESSGGS